MNEVELPSSFWALPAGVVQNNALQAVYHTLVARLRTEFAELPAFCTLDEMQIERICFMYVRMRSKEMAAGVDTTTGFDNDRAYKEFMQLYDVMSARLRKLRQDSLDAEAIRNAVLQDVEKVLNSVFDKMHPDVAIPLKANFADAFEGSNV